MLDFSMLIFISIGTISSISNQTKRKRIISIYIKDPLPDLVIYELKTSKYIKKYVKKRGGRVEQDSKERNTEIEERKWEKKE